MTNTFKLKVKVDEIKEQFDITVNLSDEELTTVERFLEYANDLLETKLVKDGSQSKLRINYDNESGIKFSSEIPNWDDVIVFIHKLRPIELKDEPTYFFKITNFLKKQYQTNILEKELMNKEISTMVSACKSFLLFGWMMF